MPLVQSVPRRCLKIAVSAVRVRPSPLKGLQIGQQCHQSGHRAITLQRRFLLGTVRAKHRSGGSQILIGTGGKLSMQGVATRWVMGVTARGSSCGGPRAPAHSAL